MTIDDSDLRVLAACYGACLVVWLWELQEVEEHMKARIAQLVARLIYGALLYFAGLAGAEGLEANAQSASEAIALGVVAAGMFLYDLWTHRKQADKAGVKTNVIGAAKP